MAPKATHNSGLKDLVLTDRNPYSELTLNQKRYVEARLQGLTAAAAERAAGICKTNTSTEKNPKIRAAIRYLIRESTASVEELTKSDVMTGMMDAVNSSATAAELVMAWREIGKLIGAYEPEKRILEIRDYTQDELRSVPDKDLLKLAGGKMQGAVDADFEELTD